MGVRQEAAHGPGPHGPWVPLNPAARAAIRERMSRCPRGRTLFGLALLAASAAACGKKSSAPLADVTVGDHGFDPPTFQLAAGGPGSHATVSFVRTVEDTCATEVVFPDLKIDQKLPLNEVVKVELPTDAPKTLAFQCGMGMYKGRVVVKAK